MHGFQSDLIMEINTTIYKTLTGNRCEKNLCNTKPIIAHRLSMLSQNRNIYSKTRYTTKSHKKIKPHLIN